MRVVFVLGGVLALVPFATPVEAHTSSTFSAPSLRARPLVAPKVKEEALLQGKVAKVESAAKLESLARFETQVEQAPTTLVPKLSIANVVEATAFPPLPPALNPVTDYQPLDTAIGDWIQKQFVEPPTATPPPNQDQLALYFSCPLLILPARFFVKAPDGCTSTARAGSWIDTSENTMLNWAEKPESISDLDMTFSMPTGDSFGSVTGEFSLTNTKVDFIDCGLNVQYYMTEKVFHAPNEKNLNLCSRYQICDGTIYMKYEIWKQGGSMVAVSGMVPMFADEFTLVDTATGGALVDFARNSAWSPTEKCPGYEKQWTVTVKNGVLSDPALRWTLGMFIQTVSMRDEERNVEGIVRLSTTQAWTWGIAAIVIVVGGGLVWLAATLFDKFLRASVTLKCINIEDTFFPMTMYKNKSYT